MEELKNYGYSRSWRHGGVEHLYWIKQVKKRLESRGYKVEEEFPIGNGETIDLAIIGKNKKIAIEIETGKSDAVRNIRKCLNAGFEVVSVSVNSTAFDQAKIKLNQFSMGERQRIRVCSICGIL